MNSASFFAAIYKPLGTVPTEVRRLPLANRIPISPKRDCPQWFFRTQTKLFNFFLFPRIYFNMKRFLMLFLIILILPAFTKPDISSFLSSLDYEFSENYTKKTFTIPNEFNLVYNNYNEIQKEAGYNLLPYKGKKCIMYTYEIYNHPFGKCNANIIVYKGEIIGGDISSVSLNGFMTGLL